MKKNAWTMVTGACVNTGVAIVDKFLKEGRAVLFTGREAERVSEAEERYRAEFPDAEVKGVVLRSLCEDGSVDEAALDDLFARLDAANIYIETLVLNAADQGLGIKIFENPLSDFLKVVNTNVTWNYAIIERAALRMKEEGGGNVVFINSNTAYRAIPNRIAYSTSKGAQLGMMRALALDLGPMHIRVNAVLPGMIRTDRWEKHPEWYAKVPSRFTPLGDVADGSDVADAVWYFAAMARNATGAELVVDGGNTVQLYPIIPEEAK